MSIKVTDVAFTELLTYLALHAFKSLNGRLFGRIDIKLGQNGVMNFMAVHLMPGLQKGYFYRACFLT